MTILDGSSLNLVKKKPGLILTPFMELKVSGNFMILLVQIILENTLFLYASCHLVFGL